MAFSAPFEGSLQAAHPISLADLRGATLLEARLLFDGAAIETYADTVATNAFAEQPSQDASHDALIDALSAPVSGREIVFIDSGVADAEVIAASFGPHVEIHQIGAGEDGVAQIADALAGRSNVVAIHIVSHGSAGLLSLGDATLTTATMRSDYAQEMQVIASALAPDADILIYGCDFAAGPTGQEAVSALAAMTGADVAASTDRSGTAALGGDWDLELQLGDVDASAVVVAGYEHALTKTVLNPTGGVLADGSDGLRIHVMTNGQYQIQYHGSNQLFEPTVTDDDAVLFNGIYLSVGSTVVGPGTNSNFGAAYNGPANGPGIASTDAIFREGGQTFSGTGSKDDPFLVTTTLYYDANNNGTYNPATDYQVVVVTGYAVPDGYMTLNVSVTPPPSNTQVVKLYHTLDTFLSGGDNGPAFSLPQNLAQTNNTTGDPTLVAVRKDPGGPNDSFVGFAEAQGGRQFTHWFSGQYNSNSIYANGINNGGDIDNGWNTNPATDNGVAVQFTLGTITTAQTWSYHIAFSSEASIDLDADNSSGVTGSGYHSSYVLGSGATIPVVDSDVQISNVTGDIQQVSVTLTNPQAGDSLTVNSAALPPGVVVVSQTSSQIVLGVLSNALPESTFDLALQHVGFTTTSNSLTSRSLSFAVTNELGIQGFASATAIGINRLPVAQDDNFAATENIPLNGNLFAANGGSADSDPDGDAFLITAINGAAFTVGVPITLAGGQLTIINALTGAFTFVPTPGYVGPEAFTYTITDANGADDTATARITVNVDTDGDGVADFNDIDDDNDGILDTVENEGAAVGNATSGSGAFLDKFYWLNWGSVFSNGVQVGDSQSFTLADGSTVTLTVTSANGGAGSMVPADMATYGGSFLDDAYNTPLPREALYDAVTSGDVRAISFAISGVDSNGRSFRPDVIFSDVETTDTGETNMATTNGSVWRAVESVGSGGSYTGANSQTVVFSDTQSGVTLFRSDGVSELMWFAGQTSVGSGSQGLALAIVRPTDSDGDGVQDSLDIDSDNDGITDNVEAQSTAGYIAPSGTGAGMIDANQDGLDDAYDPGLPGASGGLGLTPVNTDGADLADWRDSDSDNDGVADIAERGDGQLVSITSTADSDSDGLYDIFEAGTPSDGFDVNDNNRTAATLNLAGVATLNASGSNAIPLTRDLLFRDVNDAPVAADDIETTGEGTSHADSVLANNGNGADSDVEGDALTVTQINGAAFTPGVAITLPSGALLTMHGNGTYVYNPNGQFNSLGAGETANDSFTYQISDGQGGFDAATVTFTISGTNEAPVVVAPTPDQTGVDNQSGISINAAMAFADVNSNDTLTYSASGLPAGLSIDPLSGVISGTIDRAASQNGNTGAPANGAYTIVVTADDGQGGTVSDSFTFTVSNPAPMAQDDQFLTTDGAAPITGGSVLANNGSGADSDPDGDTLTVTQVNGLAGQVGVAAAGSGGGLFTITASGGFSFSQNGQFSDLGIGESRSSSITYQVSDGQGGFDTATVTVVVAGANDAPTVAAPVPDQTGVDNQSGVSINAAAAFADPDANDTLIYSASGLPAGLSIHPLTGVISGTIDRAASQNGNTGAPGSGVYTVVVTADDGHGGTVTDSFTFTVSNPPPVAQDDSLAGQEDTGFSGANVFANNGAGADADPDGDSFTVSQVNGLAGNVGVASAGSSGGLFTLTASGVLTFDPNGAFEDLAQGESRSTSITYQISDGQGGLDTATVTVTVAGANDAPVPRDPLNPAVPPADPNGYIPVQSGMDGASAPALDVTQFATDPDASDVLVFSLNPAELPPGLSFDGTTISGTYTANASQGGPAGDGVYPVVLTVSDGHGGSFTTIIVFDVGNPSPVAQDDQLTTAEDSALGGSVFDDNGQGADTDPDGDSFTVTSVAGAPANVGVAVAGSAGGLFTIHADGSYSFAPGTGFNGLDTGETVTTSVTYVITDADGATDTATVTVTIQGANDGPVIVDPLNPGSPQNPIPAVDPLNVIPDVTNASDGTPLAPIDVSAFVVDPDGETLTYALGPNVPGWISIDAATGVISGTPPHDASQLTNTGHAGEYLVTVLVSDPDGQQQTTTVTIMVGNVAPVAADDAAVSSEDGPTVTGNVLTGAGLDVDGGADTDPLSVTLASQGANPITPGVPFTTAGGGVLTLNTDGSYSFNPGNAYHGLSAGETASEVISYTLSDGNGGTDTAFLVITINGANDAPVAVDDSVSAFEDTVHVGHVLANNGQGPDSDVEGDGLTITQVNGTPLVPGAVVTLPSGALLTMNADGTYSYDPHGLFEYLGAGETASDSFSYQISDGNGGFDTAVVSITIAGANDAPVAADDVFTSNEDTALLGNVLADNGDGIDADVEHDTLTVTEVNATTYVPGQVIVLPSGALLTMAADGSYSYDPNGQFEHLAVGQTGSDSFSYQISDGQGGLDTAVVTVTINGVNDAPVATPVGIPDQNGADGNSVSLDVASVFSDVDGDALVFGAAGLPPGLSLDPDTGLITGTLTAAASQGGPYLVTVTATDPSGQSVETTLTWHVVNLAPQAAADVSTGAEDAPQSGDVLANDSDTLPDGDNLTVDAVKGQPGQVGVPLNLTYGSLVLAANGTWTFTPNATANGLAQGQTAIETVTYSLSDGNGGTVTASLSITLVGQNDAPVITSVAAQTSNDGDSITPLDVGAMFADPDGDDLQFSASNLPPGLSIDPDTGVITGALARDASQTGPYVVTVTATDPFGNSYPTSFVWAVDNPAPTAAEDVAVTLEDTPLRIDVLGNDADPDGDDLVVTSVTTPAHGTVSINPDGSLRYVPNLNFHGTDSFSYTISDGNGGVAVATVSLTVSPVNDAPSATPPGDLFATDGLSIVPVDLSTAFADVDGDDLDFSASGLPPGLVIDPETGVISGVVAPGASLGSPYAVVITATDPGGLSVSTNLMWTIGNLPPIAADDAASTPEDDAVSGNVLVNDGDTGPDSDPVVVSSVGGQAPGTSIALTHGTLVMQANGTWTFTPYATLDSLPGGSSVIERVTYGISDGQGGFDTAELELTITGSNDAPAVMTPLSDQDHNVGDVVSIPTGDLFRDVDQGDVLMFSAVNLPPGLSIDPHTGVVSGTLALTAHEGGPYAVTITARDGNGAAATGTFRWEVRAQTAGADVPVSAPGLEPPLQTSPLPDVNDEITRTSNRLMPLNGTDMPEQLVIVTTVENISSLNSSIDLYPGDTVIAKVVAWAEAQGRSAAWAHDLFKAMTFEPYEGDSLSLALESQGVDLFRVKTVAHNGALYIGIDQIAGSEVLSIEAVTGGGTAVAVTPQDLIVNVTQDVSWLQFKVTAKDQSGAVLTWHITVNPHTGEVSAQPGPEKVAVAPEVLLPPHQITASAPASSAAQWG